VKRIAVVKGDFELRPISRQEAGVGKRRLASEQLGGRYLASLLLFTSDLERLYSVDFEKSTDPDVPCKDSFF
jgi:hypothetical protein